MPSYMCYKNNLFADYNGRSAIASDPSEYIATHKDLR